jgi:hypothetical protein
LTPASKRNENGTTPSNTPGCWHGSVLHVGGHVCGGSTLPRAETPSESSSTDGGHTER